MPGPPPYPVVDLTVAHDPQQQQPHPFPDGPPTNEFRARFHRPLVAPTPFRTFEAPPAPGVSAPTSASGSAPSSGDTIDPHLGVPEAPGIVAGKSMCSPLHCVVLGFC